MKITSLVIFELHRVLPVGAGFMREKRMGRDTKKTVTSLKKKKREREEVSGEKKTGKHPLFFRKKKVPTGKRACFKKIKTLEKVLLCKRK